MLTECWESVWKCFNPWPLWWSVTASTGALASDRLINKERMWGTTLSYNYSHPAVIKHEITNTSNGKTRIGGAVLSGHTTFYSSTTKTEIQIWSALDMTWHLRQQKQKILRESNFKSSFSFIPSSGMHLSHASRTFFSNLLVLYMHTFI